jgi:hypothetical protein
MIHSGTVKWLITHDATPFVEHLNGCDFFCKKVVCSKAFYFKSQIAISD